MHEPHEPVILELLMEQRLVACGNCDQFRACPYCCGAGVLYRDRFGRTRAWPRGYISSQRTFGSAALPGDYIDVLLEHVFRILRPVTRDLSPGSAEEQKLLRLLAEIEAYEDQQFEERRKYVELGA